MQQIAEWLERLGLVQYAQRFAENDISFSVLPDLTDQDLREIGVSLGHRRQLLRAISELTGREKDAPKAARLVLCASAKLQKKSSTLLDGSYWPFSTFSPLTLLPLRMGADIRRPTRAWFCENRFRGLRRGASPPISPSLPDLVLER
jgi:hypothetical protein